MFPRIGSRGCAGKASYFADGLREPLPESRRRAILAVCAVEWEMLLADAVVEPHDRIVGRTYRTAVRTCEAQLGDETAAVREALRSFADLESALIAARDTGRGARRGDREPSPDPPIRGDLVATAAALANTVASTPLKPCVGGATAASAATRRECWGRWTSRRRPWPRPLLEAVDVLRSNVPAQPTSFLRPNSK